MKRNVIATHCILGWTFGFAGLASAEPIGTAFTFQGQVKKDGVPVNDSCDFDVGLWTADEPGGTEVGMQVVTTEVKNGLFTLKLNGAGEFGPDAFNGDPRWLEIQVSCPAGSGFASLGRQEITATPYALRAAGGIGGDSLWQLNGTDIYYNAGNVGIGTSSPVGGAPLSIFSQDRNGSAGMIHLSVTNPFEQEHRLLTARKLDLTGTTRFDWSLVTNGDFPSLQFHAIERPIGGIVTARNPLTLDWDGNVGIGTTQPDYRLEVRGGGDITPSGGGTLVVGQSLGDPKHVAIDNNEIMARTVDADGNMVVSGLALNAEGGNVSVGGTGSSVTIKDRLNLPQPVSWPCTGGLCVGGPLDGQGCATTNDCAVPATLITFSGEEFISRLTDGGGARIGADDVLVIGDGESPDVLISARGFPADSPEENTFITSDNSVYIYTDLQRRTGDTTRDQDWAHRKKFAFKDNGRVGIGTTDPQAQLDVHGRIRSTGGELWATNPNNANAAVHLSWLNDVARIRVGGEGAGATNGLDIQRTSDVSLMRILHNGNVGIGTATPNSNARLDVNGRVKASALILGNADGSNNNDYIKYDDNNDSMPGLHSRGVFSFHADSSLAAATDSPTAAISVANLYSSGKVGIGTTTPNANLQVAGDRFRLVDTSNAHLQIAHTGSNMWTWRAKSDGHLDLQRAQYDGSAFGASGATLMTVLSDGRVRVPVLEITGADVAEKFPVTDAVKPGMVVEIDPHNPGKLRLSRGAYNRRVAGVVSGAGGLSVGAVLGNLPGMEDAPPIALSGRVYVHCDASNGPIEPGDLLTTSATPGHAMKVTDFTRAHGAILGKAMTSLEEGKGLVLVLVSLQ